MKEVIPTYSPPPKVNPYKVVKTAIGVAATIIGSIMGVWMFVLAASVGASEGIWVLYVVAGCVSAAGALLGWINLFEKLHLYMEEQSREWDKTYGGGK